MSIDAQQEHGEKVRKDLNVYRFRRKLWQTHLFFILDTISISIYYYILMQNKPIGAAANRAYRNAKQDLQD